MDSPFAVLGLDSDADESDIKQAYRERVKDAHPDHGGSAEEFRAVRNAYERLKDGSWEENDYRTAGDARQTDRPGARSRSDRSRSGSNQSRSNQSRSDQSQSNRSRSNRSRSNRARADSTSAGTDARSDPDPYSEVTYLNYDVLTDFGWETSDSDLFEKAASADLDETDYGQFRAERAESLLAAAEDQGFAWPFACRGGACANCAIFLYEGELSMPGDHVLPDEMMARDIRLSCNGKPASDELKVIYNVKHMPELEDLLLPPQPFEQAYPGEL